MPSSKLSTSELKKLLHYDPLTGIFIWLVKPSNLVEAGARAGSWNEAAGYRYLTVRGKRTTEQRWAWFYMTGKWPPHEVDHKDRDRQNCRWNNLRLATRQQQLANMPARNKSGFRGVHPHKDRWAALICYNYKQMNLGLYDTPEEAHAVYCAKARELFGEFHCP